MESRRPRLSRVPIAGDPRPGAALASTTDAPDERRLVFGPLLGLSVANQLAATAVEPAAPLVPDVLGDFVYPHLLRGDVPLVPGASNVGALFHLHGPLSLLPLLLLWAAALWMLVPLVPRQLPGERP